VLQGITIDKEYLDLALDYLRDKSKNAGSDESARREALQRAYAGCQTRLKNLNKEFLSPQNAAHSIFTSAEYTTLKEEIIKERSTIEESLGTVKNDLDKVLVATERTFIFCTFARVHLNSDDLQKKRAIFSTIGSNLTLKNKKLSIERLHPYILIENELKSQAAVLGRLEPKKRGSNTEKEADFSTSLPILLRG